MGYIYSIRNDKTGQYYVGQHMGDDVKNRWKQHINESKKLHPSSSISFAMKRYGLVNFTFSLIETVDDDNVNEREKYWIKEYNSFLYGYNQTRGNSCEYKPRKDKSLYYDVMKGIKKGG